MTASPIAKLVIIIVGIAFLMVVAGSVGGSLLRGEPIQADAWDIAKVGLGVIGGVLAKTTFDDRTEPQDVNVVNDDKERIPVDPA